MWIRGLGLEVHCARANADSMSSKRISYGNNYCSYGSPFSKGCIAPIQGFQSADSIHAINLLTSDLFTVNTMCTN